MASLSFYQQIKSAAALLGYIRLWFKPMKPA